MSYLYDIAIVFFFLANLNSVGLYNTHTYENRVLNCMKFVSWVKNQSILVFFFCFIKNVT